MDTSRQLKQGTKEWLEVRLGKVTASIVAALYGKHPFVEIADVVKRLREESVPAIRKKSLAMTWGTRLEDVARRRYEKATGTKVTETGFWHMKSPPLLSQEAPYSGAPFCGGSPDGIVSSFPGETGQGIIEIKSPHTSQQPKPLVKNMMHIFQLVMNMFCTDSLWSHFISYTPAGLTIEYVPRPDTVSLGVLKALQHGEQEEWERLKVYDAKTGKYPGYGKVFFEVILS